MFSPKPLCRQFFSPWLSRAVRPIYSYGCHSFLLVLLHADMSAFGHLDRIFSLCMNVLSLFFFGSIEQHKSSFPKTEIKREKREKNAFFSFEKL